MFVGSNAKKFFSIMYIYRIFRRYTKYYLKVFRSYIYFNNTQNLVHGKIRIINKKNVKIGFGCSINQGVLVIM